MKKLILVLALGLVFGLTVSAQASIVTVTGTGDNWLWMRQGSSWSQGPNYNVWGSADTLTFDVPYGKPLDLYFAVMNETDTGGNPAGFLAQVKTDGYFLENGKSLLLSDLSWEVAVVPFSTWSTAQPPEEHGTPTKPTFDPAVGLTWKPPTSYYSNIYNTGALGWDWTKVNGIDDNALWLWTDKQWTIANGSAGMDYLAVFRTTVTPVPEPSSMMLLGMGILGLFGLGRKKIKV